MKRETISPEHKTVEKTQSSKWGQPLRSPKTPEEREKFILKNIRLLIALNAASMVLALMLFAGLLISWSANSELFQVRQEIEGLQQFEKRITARFEVMNNGIQHRLSKIDQRMGSVQSDVSLVTKGRRDPTHAIESIATIVQNEGGYFGTATAEQMLSPELSEQNTQQFVPSPSSPGISFSPAGSNDEPTSLFRRVITDDGKVRYEMKR